MPFSAIAAAQIKKRSAKILFINRFDQDITTKINIIFRKYAVISSETKNLIIEIISELLSV
jgi:hypothetical protein